MTRPKAQSVALDQLDRALVAVRRWGARPGYRRQLWAKLREPVELTTVRVLRAVERHEGGDPSVGDVATALAVAPSTGSRLVSGVVEQGLLHRQRGPVDARQTCLVLTDRGRRTLAEVTRARREVLGEITEGWTTGDVLLLAELLDRLGRRFDELEYSG